MKIAKKSLAFLLTLSILLTCTSCTPKPIDPAERSQSVKDFIEYVTKDDPPDSVFMEFGYIGTWEPKEILDYGSAEEIGEKYGYGYGYSNRTYPTGYFKSSGKSKVKVDSAIWDHFHLIESGYILNPKTDTVTYEILDNAIISMFYSHEVSYIISAEDFIEALKSKGYAANFFEYAEQDGVIYFIHEPYMA